MKGLWNYIAPSFFSDKIARQAPERGVGSILIAALLAVIFSVLAIIAAYVLPFKSNFLNTPELVATVERAFSDDGAAAEIKNGTLICDRIIDTVASDDDKREYSRGYDIVIDTRKVDTFDDFYAYCVSKSGKEITYEEYLELDADSQTLYTFKIEYSGKERVIDGDWIDRCEKFLDAATGEDTVNAYAEVKKKSGDEYAAAVYGLYIRTYYPSLTAYEKDGGAPKTRNYYYYNYNDKQKIAFVFGDCMLGLYETDFGAKNSFYGYYDKMKDGTVGTSEDEARRFIYDSVSGAVAVTVYSAITGFFSVAPFIVLAVIAASVALFCLSKLLKTEEMRFGAAAKTVCSFLTVSSIFAALITFALGFLISQSLLAWIDGVAVFGVLIIRVAVMLVSAAVRKKCDEARSGDNNDATKSEEGGI